MRRRDTLPVVDPPEGLTAEGSASKTVHGVVLAAGTSSRYGERNKLLEPINDKPLLRHAIEPLLAADLDGVTVVLGHEAEVVRDAISDLLDREDVAVTVNDRYADGQSTSVAAGVDAARERGAHGVLLALGDMPSVSVDAIEALLATYREGREGALAAAVEGERGNPVLFDRRYFDDLRAVDGDVGGRELLLADGVAVETGDPGVLRDVDRPNER